MGLLNFYGSLVPKLQSILQPLNRSLTGEQAKKIDWCGPRIKAFEKAKAVFTKQIPTHLPDFRIPFIVTTDASEKGLGACLSEKGADGRDRPIAFFSKSIVSTHHEDGDAAMLKTRELELYAFLLASRKWRHYLYGRKFEWRTDHKPLLWDEKNPTKKVANWLSELKELNFTSTYVKGEENIVADALSRQPYNEHTTSNQVAFSCQQRSGTRY